MSTPQAGWYADPAGSHLLRWYDGTSWTNETKLPDPPSVPSIPTATPPAYTPPASGGYVPPVSDVYTAPTSGMYPVPGDADAAASTHDWSGWGEAGAIEEAVVEDDEAAGFGNLTAKQGGLSAKWILIAGVGLVLAAALIVGLMFWAGSGTPDPLPVVSATPTATPTPTPSVPPTTAPSPSPTQTPTTVPSPTPTPSVPPTTAPTQTPTTVPSPTTPGDGPSKAFQKKAKSVLNWLESKGTASNSEFLNAYANGDITWPEDWTVDYQPGLSSYCVAFTSTQTNEVFAFDTEYGGWKPAGAGCF